MKKLTLDINERQEQEDYQGRPAPVALMAPAGPVAPAAPMAAPLSVLTDAVCVAEMMQSLAQRPAPANTNRERRPRYQHPKGAPNADLIFKTGGR